MVKLQAIAVLASVLSALCNIILIVLLYLWYGPKSGKK